MQDSQPPPWWRTDTYDRAIEIPKQIEWASGPHGPALVRSFKDGKTDPGWGLAGKDGAPGFMERYTKGQFSRARVLTGYAKGRHNFAFVMRSLKMVCIDIDGKNGGLEHVGQLGMLPLTLAETSKSGDGYHLFYLTKDDVWSDTYGFGLFNDRIGIRQGVDIRATGCVFHHPQQRWNNRNVAELPPHIGVMLRQKQQAADAQVAAIIKTLDAGDATEILLMQDNLLTDLAKPIPAGRRNSTLFAIGSQMFLAGRRDWEQLIRDRAYAVGLDLGETDKLVKNISKYSPTGTP